MQLALVQALLDRGKWIYEAKLDGYRCLAANRSGGVVLWSRRGNGFTMRFPQIARACEKLPPDTLIDGEVVVVDADGKVKFQRFAAQPKRRRSKIWPNIAAGTC